MTQRHCDTCECEFEPTPEETAADREREMLRLEARMTPARNVAEQARRDADNARKIATQEMQRIFWKYGGDIPQEVVPEIVGLLAVGRLR
jgi:hypothetical protein